MSSSGLLPLICHLVSVWIKGARVLYEPAQERRPSSVALKSAGEARRQLISTDRSGTIVSDEFFTSLSGVQRNTKVAGNQGQSTACENT